MNSCSSKILSIVARSAATAGMALALGALSLQEARASSFAGEEVLTLETSAIPNVLFLLDLSSSMNEPCPKASDAGFSGRPTGSKGKSSEEPCIQEVLASLDRITQHYDWARYGIVGTADRASKDVYTPIVALGANHADFSDAIASCKWWGPDHPSYFGGKAGKCKAFNKDVRNLGEALASVSQDYFSNTRYDDLSVDEDAPRDGYGADWNRAPIKCDCQQNHVIIITNGRPQEDDNPSLYANALHEDATCGESSEECLLDNVVRAVYDQDLRGDLQDTQNIVTHIVGIGQDFHTEADILFDAASAQQNGEGLYMVADDAGQILGTLINIMASIRAGHQSRSTPVLSSDGAHLVHGYYELDGGLLGKGHLLTYDIDTDPDSDTYGQIAHESGDLYDGSGSARWDAGELLTYRPVEKNEVQDADMDGAGSRDIFTFVDQMMDSSLASDALFHRRMPFDASFAQALSAAPWLLEHFLDDSETDGNLNDAHSDLNNDGVVDHGDMQALIDFTRGYERAEFKYLDPYRGSWRLGDFPHSTPAVVTPRSDVFAIDPSYRTYLNALEDDETVPSMIYVASNAGMLHAFYLEDVPATAYDESGEEAWAWVPGYLLEKDHHAAWAGRLTDPMIYGRSFLLDGTPMVEDVWIDENANGARDCDAAAIESVWDLEHACEWHRVLVVQQGKGGPVTLALDVTNPLDPLYLWEQLDIPEREIPPGWKGDESAVHGENWWVKPSQGHGLGHAVITRVYDARDPDHAAFRPVAIWGSGRAAPASAGDSYYSATEANLFMWAIGDDYFRGTSAEWNSQAVMFNVDSDHRSSTWENSGGFRMTGGGSNGHPEADSHPGSTLDFDHDGRMEYGYIAATPTVVDVDSDGGSDVIYFPVATTYGSEDTGDSHRTDIDGAGQVWMWKGLIDSSAPDDIIWCEEPFYDPYATLGLRPTVSEAATASWFHDGTLGLYWGTGTPDGLGSDEAGFFFAVRGPDPAGCAAAEELACRGDLGHLELEPGEELTSKPIVYAGVVYFTTYTPEQSTTCGAGIGRLYGLMYDDCSKGLDTDEDGIEDDWSIEIDGYTSGLTISDQGIIYVGSSNAGEPVITAVNASTDDLRGVETIMWASPDSW